MIAKVSAYQRFRDRLFAGELAPGQFVTQKELATLAGVSLGAAREAIQKLEHESLLKVHAQRGIQIADVTVNFIRNAFGLRLILEKEAVRAVATGAAESLVGNLLQKTRAILDEATGDASEAVLERAVDVDWYMHDVLIDHLGNDLVSETYRINAVRIRLIRVNNRLSSDRVVSALHEHVRILQCCVSRDPEAAAAAMEDHIATAMNRALQGK